MTEIVARQIKTGTADGDLVELGAGGTLPVVNGAALTNVDAITVNGASAGTGVNDLVQLNGSSQLPAVDGSLITSMTKSQVGLSAVNNTSDVAKPVSNATQTALNAKTDGNGFKNIYEFRVNSTGGQLGGSMPGFSSTRTGLGQYTVSHTLGGSISSYRIYITIETANGYMATVTAYTASSFKVYLHDHTGALVDSSFNGLAFDEN